MKILQKIAMASGALIFLLLLFVVFCAINPDFTKAAGRKLTGWINSGQPQEMADAAGEAAGAVTDGLGGAADTALKGVADAAQQVGEIIGDWNLSLEEDGDAADSDAAAPSKVYTPPEEENLLIPQEVLGHTGYTPVQDGGKEIGEDQGQEVLQYIGCGETGEDLDFPAKYYPYYAMLDETGQRIYRQIYANAQALVKQFAPVAAVEREGLKNAFMAVVGDHPELFWLDTAYECQYVPSGQVAEVVLRFNRTADDLVASKREFEQAASEVLELALGREGASMSDYEMEAAIHDALLSKVNYDSRAQLNQSAYSALVNGASVCAGYARAFQYLCQKCDIPCYYCTGFSGEDHAWNIVGLDGDYYNVDATWDDAAVDSRAYFNGSDADFGRDHVRRDLSVYLPACNGETYRGAAGARATATGDDGTSIPTYSLNDLGFDPNSYYGYGDDHTLRTVSDTGISDVQTTLREYYDACYDRIVGGDANPLRFQLVVSDYQLMEDICNSYHNGSYRNGFGFDALNAIGADSWDMRVNVEALQGDFYLLTHTVSVN